MVKFNYRVKHFHFRRITIMNEQTLTTQLNGTTTELTEEEIALLFDYRTVSEEQKAEINSLVEKLSEQKDNI